VWILSYSQLAHLKPAERRYYLTELRAIVIEFEKGSESGIRASLEPSWREQIAQMLIFPEARADANACGPDENADGNGSICVYKYTTDKHEDYSKDGYNCGMSDTGPGHPKSTWMCWRKNDGSSIPIIARVGNPVVTVAQPPAAPLVAAGADNGSCKALVPTCGDREQYRAEFYKTPRKCLYAGNVSSYPGNIPKKGGCTPIRSFTLSAGSGEDLKCTKKGEIICNPFVFGVKSAGEPICAKGGGEATKNCDKASPSADNNAKFFDGSQQGLSESWNEFVDSIRNLCTEDQASAQFHCGECKTIYNRLFKLNGKVLGNLCEKGQPSPEATPIQQKQQEQTPAPDQQQAPALPEVKA
jgi:hypothetical protein